MSWKGIWTPFAFQVTKEMDDVEVRAKARLSHKKYQSSGCLDNDRAMKDIQSGVRFDGKCMNDK